MRMTQQDTQATELQELQDKKQQLELRLDVSELEAAVRAMDPAYRSALLEAGEILADRREYLYDTPDFGFDPLLHRHISNARDREGGRNRPFVETEVDLAAMRGIGRWLATVDEVSIGVLDSLANYTVGTGFTYTVSPKREGAVPEGLVEAVQDVIDEFVEENKWRRREREALIRRHRDGEFFLWAQHVGAGRVRPRFVEPDYVIEPPDPRALSEFAGAFDLDWSFGIASNLGDPETVHGYYIDWSGDGRDWDFAPATELEHAKANVDSGVKRGISDFYAAWREIESANKLSDNTAKGSAVQAAIAYVRQHAEGTTRSQVQSLNSGKADFTLRRRTVGGTTRSSRQRRIEAGTVVDIPKGMEYQPGPLGAQRNPQFVTAIQMVLRRVGVRWNLPEYLISGDASNANFASTMVAESPFVKSSETRQEFYSETFRDFFWKVIRIAFMWGRLSRWPGDFRQLRRLLKIDAQAPRVSVRNRQEETTIRSTLHEKGVLSRKTWAALEELDHEVEQEQLEEEGGPARPASAGLLNPTLQAAIEGVLESANTPEDVRRAIRETYP